jgi:hypothetical protein
MPFFRVGVFMQQLYRVIQRRNYNLKIFNRGFGTARQIDD